MFIIDKELKKIEKRGNPIKVAMVGAGFFGRGLALQFQTAATGMRLVAISNRTLDKAIRAYKQSGVQEIAQITSQKELDEEIDRGKACVTTKPFLLCESREIDVIIEATAPYNLAQK